MKISEIFKVERNEYEWLCNQCGKHKSQTHEIWGSPARGCQNCGRFAGLICKYVKKKDEDTHSN